MHKCLILTCLMLWSIPAFGQDSPILLHGKAEKKHHAKHDDYKRDEPSLDSYSSKKQTNAAANAIGIEDQELMIEWDKWRNRFSRKVWLKLNEKLTGGLVFNIGGILLTTGEGSGYNFRKGIEVSYMCEVTNDRRITNLHVTSPSGDPTYDNLVLACVASLNGKSSLRFPEGSKRTRVRTAATLKIGKAYFHETKYNDKEFVKLTDATD